MKAPCAPGPFTLATTIVVASLGVGSKYYFQKPASSIPVDFAAVQEAFGGGHVGAVCAAMFVFWLAIVIAALLIRGPNTGKAIAISMIKFAITTVISTIVTVVIGSITAFPYSTGWIFNGPKHNFSGTILKTAFDAHHVAYKLAPVQIKAMTTLALASFVISMLSAVGSQIVGYLLQILEILPQKVQKILAFSQKLVFGFLGLLIVVPSILLCAGWICWVIMIFTGRIVGENSVLAWNVDCLAFYEKFTDGMPSKVVSGVFGLHL